MEGWRMMSKPDYIKFFRDNGFNCFPIPYGQKVADYRYKASKTMMNQQIHDNENYGVLPVWGNGNAIIDIDNKERYREFAEHMIDDGYMVIESPNGWHVPVIGISGQISKVELFDYNIQDKKIIEIQGTDHYCVGVESEIVDKKSGETLKYVNRGTNKIWDGKGRDFHHLIDTICKACNVTARQRASRSSYKNLRDRFKKGDIPLKGTSNDYFFQAALQCNTDGLSLDEALEKIQGVYNKWVHSEHFSNRPWENIVAKIEEVYNNDKKIKEGRPTKKDSDGLPTAQIAKELTEERRLFSDVDTGEIYEDVGGFLKRITNELVRDLHEQYPEMKQHDYSDILFKLKGYSPPRPDTNKDMITFKNGRYSISANQLVESDDISDMGFADYDYVEDAYPTEFIKIMFDNVPKEEHPRIKAGLKAIFQNYLDPKISVIYGLSGVGKSTPLTILNEVLGTEYSLTVELSQFLEDKFIRAKINGLRLLVFQDLPKQWKDFATLKTITGEQRKTERGFMQDSTTFDNKLKIWASGNYLAKMPEEEQDAMYTRRLSLIHNTRLDPHKEDPTLVDRVVESEAEQIVSWILNIPNEDCKYEDKQTIKREWEEIASPELGYLEQYWEFSDSETEWSVMRLVKDFQEKYQKPIAHDTLMKTLKSLGYVVKFNIIKNIQPKQQPKPQEKLG